MEDTCKANFNPSKPILGQLPTTPIYRLDCPFIFDLPVIGKEQPLRMMYVWFYALIIRTGGSLGFINLVRRP